MIVHSQCILFCSIYSLRGASRRATAVPRRRAVAPCHSRVESRRAAAVSRRVAPAVPPLCCVAPRRATAVLHRVVPPSCCVAPHRATAELRRSVPRRTVPPPCCVARCRRLLAPCHAVSIRIRTKQE